MGRADAHTLIRRLRILTMIATAVHPIRPDDIIDEIGQWAYVSQDAQAMRRSFFYDMDWLRNELDAEIVYRRAQCGYQLLSLPAEIVEFARMVGEWKPRKRRTIWNDDR